MKLKRTVLLAVGVIAMGLQLGTGTAQAQTVILDPGSPEKRAIGITDLDIDGTNYDVDFISYMEAGNVYNELPGEFDFNTEESAQVAVDAVDAALNTEGGVIYVGSEGGRNTGASAMYSVGYGTSAFRGVTGCDQWRSTGDSGTWTRTLTTTTSVWWGDSRTWAIFSEADPPAPVDEVQIGGRVITLEGSGLVLQNNGGDDETITGNGPFTFDTALVPNTTYSVTVATNPSSPDQQCFVARASGTVPTEDVTNIVVICVPFQERPETAFLPAIYHLLSPTP